MRLFVKLLPTALSLAAVTQIFLMGQTPAAPKAATKASATKAAPKAAAAKSATPATATKAGAAKSAATAKAKAKAAPTPTPMTEEQKTIYALGLSVQRSLAPLDLSLAEIEIVKTAILDAMAGKPAVDLNTYAPKFQPLAAERAARIATRTKAEALVYLTKAAAEPGAKKTASGLIYRETVTGSGPSPKATDTVKVNYRGTLPNGTEFDSSYKRNEPISFGLNQVIKCWTEGVQLMKVGGKATLVCPSDIAYGDAGSPPTIPGGATLVFEIELLGIGG
ncbi:MAG: FKBP-type peptidyl-prolyl cis-trans isomerase [Acidobacteriota bacterium]